MERRIAVFKLIFILLLAFVVIRLGYWQIMRSDDMVAKADSQRTVTHTTEANRGDILFSDNSVLTTTEPAYLIYVQPKVIDSKYNQSVDSLELHRQEISQTLAQNLWQENKEATTEAIKKQQISSLQSKVYDDLKKDLYWVSLGDKVDVDTKSKIEKLKLVGVGFDQTSLREYPEGSSSAHLLGFVASDEYGESRGYFGLEGFYDGELRGKGGSDQMEVDAQGNPILIGKFNTIPAKNGATLVLNIDRTIQHDVETQLLAGIQKYKATGGSVVIMDPKTGAIIAMASYPNYDPNDAFSYPSQYYKNPVTTEGYEPGSTFKVLMMAAGINDGVVTPDTVCDICNKPVQIGNYAIHTWNNQYEQNLTMMDTIIHSDNTGMTFLALKLGLQKELQYIKSFGIGQPTGVDLQDEDSPPLRPDDEWHEIDQATASFGQGISVTALQLVRAVGAIANGGKMMEPHVVKQVIDPNKTYTIDPKVVGQPITAQTASTVTQMMIRAVNEGESSFYRLKNYTVAGKTGTAQIPIQGYYDPSKTIASFVGFAPANDPKFVMLVKYDEPKSSIYGAETAAPTFFSIAKDLFTYYGIPPNQ